MGGYFEKQIRKEMIMQLQVPEGPILKDFIRRIFFFFVLKVAGENTAFLRIKVFKSLGREDVFIYLYLYFSTFLIL